LKSFIEKNISHITGSLNCFDRVIFKGHLKSISYPAGLDKIKHHAEFYPATLAA